MEQVDELFRFTGASDPHLSEDDLERLRGELGTFYELGLIEPVADGTYRVSTFMQRVVDLYTLAKGARLLDDR